MGYARLYSPSSNLVAARSTGLDDLSNHFLIAFWNLFFSSRLNFIALDKDGALFHCSGAANTQQLVLPSCFSKLSVFNHL